MLKDHQTSGNLTLPEAAGARIQDTAGMVVLADSLACSVGWVEEGVEAKDQYNSVEELEWALHQDLLENQGQEGRKMDGMEVVVAVAAGGEDGVRILFGTPALADKIG